MTEPLWSILIPSVPRRRNMTERLWDKLSQQIQALAQPKRVQLLLLRDNVVCTIGEKRSALLWAANGTFLSFVDDDDDVADSYVKSIVQALDENPALDLLTFSIACTIDGKADAVVVPDLRCTENEEYVAGALIRRMPHMLCVWRSGIARQAVFPLDSSFGEDFVWAKQVIPHVRKWHALNSILYHYRFERSLGEPGVPK